MAGLNKKILCFMDEYGTPGEDSFAFGCVMVWSRECGKVDKAFSDLLPPSVNEVHAVTWKSPALQGLLARFAQSEAPSSLMMMNKQVGVTADARPVLYAFGLIETVKIGVKRFAKAQGIQDTVGNVEVITDANEQNTHPAFMEVIDEARRHDGRFKAVTRVVPLDSAASRVLQLADVVAHTRAWMDKAGMKANHLRDAYNIEIL